MKNLTPINTGRVGILFLPFFLLFMTIDSRSQTVDYGKSYVNITKGSNGGTIEPADTLEMRATFVVKSGTAFQCSYTDNIPANTTYLPGTLRVLTDEGVIYQQLTDALDADGGTFSGTGVTINMGGGATSALGGTISFNSKPSFYNSACIVIGSYRVVVKPTLAYGTRLQLGGGTLQYTNAGGTVIPITFPVDSAIVHPNTGLCANVQGANAVLSESGGTFGSGSLKDRPSPSATVPATYTNAVFSSSAGMPNDYYYGISNNTSGGTTPATGYSTSNTWPFPDNSSPSHRIFGSWEIIGDHTGAPTPAGNPPTDDNAGQTGGYMLVINSSYRTNITFTDTVKNLCPLTEYTYSAWFRNICERCGCDSNGRAWSNAGYHPQAPGDSSGIHPNLTFNVNGLDYYTTGEIPWTGTWVQKGLVYHTRAGQTSMIINIRNNAPGGGGNDWALDDVSVATCTPDMTLAQQTDIQCQGTTDTVRFLVSSTFHVYTAWELQKSVDGGLTWLSPGNDTSGLAASGVATPVLDPADKEYKYTITRNYGLNVIDTSIMYRLIVADSLDSLSSTTCAFTGSTVKIVKASNCNIALPTSIIAFRGNIDNALANLQWTTTNETGREIYSIERSDDGQHFTQAGTARAIPEDNGNGIYHFTDPRPVFGEVNYRIRLSADNYYKYSNRILLSNADIKFGIRSIANPFTDHISFDLASPGNGTAVISLIDMYGKLITRVTQGVRQGLSAINLNHLGGLSSGIYTLQILYADKVIYKQMLKLM